ncbi:MAG: membrane protein insertion efficiency factor YidD [Thermoleophilaceae bacterium]|nr:membrane protein insertion efficiency factor YidD [Thermoleophilaceae bacterium]
MLGWPARTLLLGLISAYRVSLSGVMGGGCRFHPSCSEYAREAIRNVGALRGGAFSLWRVVRCSPLSAGGVDRPPLPVYDTSIRRERPSADTHTVGARA